MQFRLDEFHMEYLAEGKIEPTECREMRKSLLPGLPYRIDVWVVGTPFIRNENRDHRRQILVTSENLHG